MLKKRKGFTALLEFLLVLLVLFIAAAALPIMLGANKENYANQAIASLQIIATKTRLSDNVLSVYGINNIVDQIRDEAQSVYPDMDLSCNTTNDTAIQTCTISYEILWVNKSKTISFSDTYIDDGDLLGG